MAVCVCLSVSVCLSLCVCVVFKNVNQEAAWKSHLAVIMKNGPVFILKWGVITGSSLWDGARDERTGRRGGREIKSEVRDGGKCASIIWRACCVSCCGLGAGHDGSGYLENIELNTGNIGKTYQMPRWSPHWMNEWQRSYILRAGDVS